MTNPAIFKAYDIRGLYPAELDEKTAYALGMAVVEFSQAKRVLVGRDCRLSSPALADELIAGITSAGAEVVDIGLSSTPLCNFSVASHDDLDFGVMVSASHNPKEYNGFKLDDSRAMPIGRDSGMDKIKELTLKYLDTPPTPGPSDAVITENYSTEYLDKIFSFVDAKKTKPFKIVVDTANAMGGLLIDEITARLPQVQVEYLYKDLDGKFPNHEANPLKHDTLEALRAKVLATQADLGVAYDGDADRIGFVDEKGEVVPGDALTALLAGRVLARLPAGEAGHPGALILGDVRFSWSVPEYIKELGGEFAFCQVGHALIKRQMKTQGGEFAGELSLHFYYKDFYGVESGDLTMLYVLDLLSHSGKKLSELIKPLQRYYHSGEINFTVSDKDKIIKTIKDKYLPQAKKVIDIDGIRLEFDSWWFSLRASNTEPLLRLNLEAKSETEMKERIEEMKRIITS